MSKDFILISGHGIFPKSSILQAIPNVSEDFYVEVIPPENGSADFMFMVVKDTEINVEIHRLVPGSKKDEIDKIIDNQYTRIMKEQYDLKQAEILSMLYGDTPDESVVTAIKNYKRRLKKIDEYKERVAVIQKNPSLPDYESALAAIAKDAPSPEHAAKQQKSLDRIKSHLQEKVLEIIEASDADADEDTEEHPLIEMFETEEHDTDISNKVNDVLLDFYSNFNELNVGMPYSDSTPKDIPAVEEMEQAFEHADRIRDGADAISNREGLAQDEEETEEESPSEE